MNGENFKKLVESDFIIDDINIFLRLETGDINQLKYTAKEEQKNKIKETLKDEIKKLKEKTPKLYDTYKGKEEFFYLNLDQVGEIEEIKNVQKKLSSRNNIITCSKYPGKIKYVIIEILTSDKKFLIFTYYSFNQFFNKKIMGSFLNESFSIEKNSEENIIINFSPEVIFYEDEIILTTNTIKIFDLSIIFKKCIEDNIELVNNVFKLDKAEKINKKQQIFLSRGIFNGNLKKFSNFSDERKKELLTKFEEKYNDRFGEEVRINYTSNTCIMLDNLSARQKEEVIKYTTNRSAYKVLDEKLTTSVD